MKTSEATVQACRWGARAAICTLCGIVVSGPLAILVLSFVHPQPPWSDPETFARHYHWLQALPYFGGFFLVFGFVTMMASLYVLAPAEQKAGATTAVIFTAAFAALVLLNYVIQTTFVPHLARHYSAQSANVIAALSMANPSSLAWALEMWAYGFLGIAHLLIAPVFSRTAFEGATAILFVVNGVSSVATALWTAVDPGWMMTLFGIGAYTVWNVLILAMVSVALVAFRRRMEAIADANPAPRCKDGADSSVEHDIAFAGGTPSALHR
jgi:hypothetical protein